MVAHDRDNAMSGLLRRSLQTDAGTPGKCLGHDTLAAYFERSLSPDEIPGCELHVSHCGRCREQLALMARTEAVPQPEPRHTWLLDWRLLISAATALLILTVWGVHRPASKLASYHSANEPLVALSKSNQGVPLQPSLSPASASVPPSGVAGESRSQPELDQVSPQPQTRGPEAPSAMRKKLSRDLPFNGHEANGKSENSLKIRSEQQAVRQANRAEQKDLDEKSAAAPTTILSEPAVAAQLAAPPSTANSRAGSAAGNVVSGADASAPVEPPEAKQQSESGAIADRLGAANESSITQSTGLRSAQTIIRTPDPKVLWRIAGGGFVERSVDSGATWQGQNPESGVQFTAGAAPTTKALWLVGGNGMILLTKDTSHWKKIPPPIPADFVSVEAKSASSATVTTTEGQRFSTTNSGKMWVPAP